MLAVAPGPMHPALGNLDPTDSSAGSMLMPALVRTPDRHEPQPSRTPILKPSTNSGLQVAGLQGCANSPRPIERGLKVYTNMPYGCKFLLAFMLFAASLLHPSFLSVAVITCASHAQGRRFEPGRKQC